MRSLAVLAAAVLLAGCGSTRVITEPAQTVTVTGSATSPAPPGRARYRGNGTENLGTIKVAAASEISWRCSGCKGFALTSHSSGASVIAISSTAAAGTSAIDPGDYADAQVISDGDWTIKVTPG